MKLEVVGAVVGGIPVAMVDDLGRSERPSKHCFHYGSVLANPLSVHWNDQVSIRTEAALAVPAAFAPRRVAGSQQSSVVPAAKALAGPLHLGESGASDDVAGYGSLWVEGHSSRIPLEGLSGA